MAGVDSKETLTAGLTADSMKISRGRLIMILIISVTLIDGLTILIGMIFAGLIGLIEVLIGTLTDLDLTAMDGNYSNMFALFPGAFGKPRFFCWEFNEKN